MTAVPVPPAPTEQERYEAAIREALRSQFVEAVIDGKGFEDAIAEICVPIVAAEVAAERERIAQAIEALPIDERWSGHWRNGMVSMQASAAEAVRNGATP